MKYTEFDLASDFPNEAACLSWLVDFLYPNGITCPKCQRITKHYPMRKRRSYSCGICGHYTQPLAGTIFYRSSTPLTVWFRAIYKITATRAGISAKQLERELGVTYKTAWRMLHQIRDIMNDDDDEPLSGKIEIDEAYIHADTRKRSSAQKRYGRNGRDGHGQILFGMVERGGAVKIRHVRSSGVRVLAPAIEHSVTKGSVVYSDDYGSYRTLKKRGYEHQTTNHSKFQFVDGDNYTQNIENVWSHLKRGIKGVYRHVSPRHLQRYANEFAFRYSHRNDEQPMFYSLLEQVKKDATSS
jgi:transposase-like protein